MADNNREPIKGLIRVIKDALKVPVVETGTLEKIMAGYGRLTREEKAEFFCKLLDEVEVRPEETATYLSEVIRSAGDPIHWRRAIEELRSKLESPRWILFRQFIRVHGGLKLTHD